MATVSVRYIVDDVAAAIGSIPGCSAFPSSSPGPSFAMLRMRRSSPVVNGTTVPAEQRAMPTKAARAGGWNRIQVEVANLDEEVERLAARREIRNEIRERLRGPPVLLEDPPATRRTVRTARSSPEVAVRTGRERARRGSPERGFHDTCVRYR